MRPTPAVVLALTAALACGRSPQASLPHAAPPAKVQNPVSEADLATVKLSLEAETRLGIRTALIEEKAVERTRRVGGEVVVPPGRALTVTAPIAGTVLAPVDALPPVAGAPVGKRQAVFRLRPLPGSADLAAADARLEAARARARRAEQLLEVGAGSGRAVEEAKADLAAAESTAQSLRPGADAGTGDALVVSSPVDGLIRDVRVAPGQSVAVGAALFDVAARDPLWLRVPLYVGDLSAVDAAKGARIHDLSEAAGAAGRPARFIAGPPSADAAAATADLYFEAANHDGRLRPGQRVGVSLALRGQERGRVVPWSAVLYDFEGGTWVYENTSPQVFVRRRVEVSHVASDMAVLARGPAAGAKIVTIGAAELFGTELGSGK